jgi:thymidylate kinase
MIVELIGCTGVGKTTVMRGLRAHGIGELPTRTMGELVLDRPALRRVAHPTAVNVAQELYALPALAVALRRRRAFLAFASRNLLRHAPSPAERLSRVRAIVRRTGMFEVASRPAHAGELVLSDEGTVLLAFMFPLDGRPYDTEELARFAKLVPLPDLVVHVRAPLDLLVRRARARTDRGRQLGAMDADELELLLRRTSEVFDTLAGTAPVRDRVVTIDGSLGSEALPGLAATLADRLRLRGVADSARPADAIVPAACPGAES